MNSGFTAYRIRARPGSMASTCASTSRAAGASFCRLWMSSRSFSSWVPGRPSPPVTSSPADREGDVERHWAALQEQGEPVTLLQAAREALEVGHAAHVLAVDLLDDVAALDARLGGGAPVLEPRHEHAFEGAETQPRRDLRRDRPHLEPEQRARAAPEALLRLALVRRLADLHLERDLLLLAPDLELRVLVGREETDGALEIARPLELLAVELQQDVAALDAGLGRGAVGYDLVDEHALRRLGADDPRRHRGLQAERRADGDHPVADVDLVRVAQSSEAKIALAVVQLEHGQVGLLVQADDLRLVLAAVERDDLDVGRPFDDVGVGERDARRVHDDAGAQAPLGDPLGDLAEEAAVELLTEELLEGRPPLEPARHGVDVDHGGLDRVRDGGERAARQRHLRGQDRRLDRGRLGERLGAGVAPPLDPHAERRADHEGQPERDQERLALYLHHGRVSSVTPSPASARRSASPSSVSMRFSSRAAAIRTAFFVVRTPQTRSWVRSRIARTSSSMVRAVASL